MPFSLLIALFLAFGTDSPANLGPISRSELAPRLRETLLGVSLVASVAGALGRWVAFRTSRRGKPSLGLRRLHAWGARGLEGLTLAVYGWMIHDVGWPWVVHSGWGFRGAILIDDVLILLPFLLMQLAGWWGLYPAERALRIRGDVGLGRHLALKARGSLGMVLPVVLLFAAGQDLAHRLWPKAAESLWALPVGLIVMGGLVLVLSPIFVRLAWPTRPLPPGPLRDRLERLARRFGFRCTDILVWDTGHVVVNAGVTGALPWFRYVLLSDALVDCLDDHQIAAVFGHEIGHIAHRHLLYFGFFFLGSLGVMALVCWALDGSPLARVFDRAWRDDPAVTVRSSRRRATAGVGGPLLPGGLRLRLAAVRASGRRLRLPRRLLRPGGLPAPRSTPTARPATSPRRPRSARSGSGSSPTRWRMWPRSTGWSTAGGRGGTAASRGGSPSSRASRASPRPSVGSSAASRGSASSWPWG